MKTLTRSSCNSRGRLRGSDCISRHLLKKGCAHKRLWRQCTVGKYYLSVPVCDKGDRMVPFSQELARHHQQGVPALGFDGRQGSNVLRVPCHYTAAELIT